MGLTPCYTLPAFNLSGLIHTKEPTYKLRSLCGPTSRQTPTPAKPGVHADLGHTSCPMGQLTRYQLLTHAYTHTHTHPYTFTPTQTPTYTKTPTFCGPLNASDSNPYPSKLKTRSQQIQRRRLSHTTKRRRLLLYVTTDEIKNQIQF